MTGFLDRQVQPWWDRLKFAFLRTPLLAVDVRLGDEPEKRFLPPDEPSRRKAAAECAEGLKRVRNAERLSFLAKLPRLLKVEIPPNLPWPPMTWHEVRELAANGVTFGAHTITHPILASLETEAELRNEIEGSRDRLREELGRPPLHFSYPNGLVEDIGESARRIAEKSGFRSAVSAISALNRSTEEPFMLKRLSVDPDLPLPYFGQRLAGLSL